MRHLPVTLTVCGVILFQYSAVYAANGINSAQGNLPIGAGGNPVMVVTPDGKVGIGSPPPTNPLATLDVGGIANVGGLGIYSIPYSVSGKPGWGGGFHVFTKYPNMDKYPNADTHVPTESNGTLGWGVGAIAADSPSNPNLFEIHFFDGSKWNPYVSINNNGNIGLNTYFPDARYAFDTTPMTTSGKSGAIHTTSLDADQQIRIGTTGASCDAGNAGAIQWNGTNFQGCDGSSWRNLMFAP